MRESDEKRGRPRHAKRGLASLPASLPVVRAGRSVFPLFLKLRDPSTTLGTTKRIIVELPSVSKMGKIQT